MNWGRGASRLWVVISVGWIVLYSILAWGKWTTGIACATSHWRQPWETGPWCLYWSALDYYEAFAPFVAVPVGLLIIGFAAKWIIRGILHPKEPN